MLHDIASHPPNRLRVHKMLGEAPTIHESSVVLDSRIGAWTDIGPHCSIVETTFDDYSYVAGDAQIIYADIGKFCSIASHVRINPGNHPMDRVTQHHMTYCRAEYGFGDTDDAAFFDWRRSHKCVIGHDVWIGHAAVIMPGVRVGTGAVVGSNAVVTKDVVPYEIVVGVPAKPIRKRFDDNVIAALCILRGGSGIMPRWRRALQTSTTSTSSSRNTLDAPDALRELIVYACPTGALAEQLQLYLDRTRAVPGPNAAHRYPPHISLTGFFHDDATAVPKYVNWLSSALQRAAHRADICIKTMMLELNFHGLIIESPWLRQLASDFAALAQSPSRKDQLRLKDWLHLSLAYEFSPEQHECLKSIAQSLVDVNALVSWELCFYERRVNDAWCCLASWPISP